MSSTTMKDTRAGWDWNVWFQWILANAVGETVGLGGTLVIGGLLLLKAQATMGVVPAAVLAVLAGKFIEGTGVGTAQWLLLPLPNKTILRGVLGAAHAIGASFTSAMGVVSSTCYVRGCAYRRQALTQVN